MIAESAMAGKVIALTQQPDDLLEAAVLEHSRLVYRIAYSVLRNPADAEDATQETFLRVLRHGKKLAGVRDQKAWVAQIVWRIAVERRRQVVLSVDQMDEASDSLPSPAIGADRLLLAWERSAILDQLVEALPEQLRQPLILSTIEEIAPQQIALVLGITEAAVRSRTFRARQILREKLLVLFDTRK